MGELWYMNMSNHLLVVTLCSVSTGTFVQFGMYALTNAQTALFAAYKRKNLMLCRRKQKYVTTILDSLPFYLRSTSTRTLVSVSTPMTHFRFHPYLSHIAPIIPPSISLPLLPFTTPPLLLSPFSFLFPSSFFLPPPPLLFTSSLLLSLPLPLSFLLSLGRATRGRIVRKDIPNSVAYYAYHLFRSFFLRLRFL